jgi:hypothetical protein
MAQMEELGRESLLVPMRQRIRDLRQGPDELLYLLTDDAKNGANPQPFSPGLGVGSWWLGVGLD